MDASPTKAYMIEHREDLDVEPLYQLGFGKRPREELYDLRKDPAYMHNVSERTSCSSGSGRLAGTLADTRGYAPPCLCNCFHLLLSSAVLSNGCCHPPLLYDYSVSRIKVAQEPGYADVRAELEARLLSVLTKEDDPRLMEQPCRYELEPYAAPSLMQGAVPIDDGASVCAFASILHLRVD
jgi:hypothetical protein